MKSSVSFCGAVIFAVALFVCAPAVQAQFWGGSAQTRGSGKIVSDTRETPEFSKIHVKSSAEVVVKNGSKREVRVEADDNIIENVVTEVRDNGTLVITMERGSWSFSRLKVFVTMPSELEGVEISGSGSVNVESGVRSKTMNANISGSGSITFADGKTGRLDARVSGSGNVQAENFSAESVAVQISGSGNASVFAQKSLDVRISGSGNVYYKGAPADVKQTVRGSGKIVKR